MGMVIEAEPQISDLTIGMELAALTGDERRQRSRPDGKV